MTLMDDFIRWAQKHSRATVLEAAEGADDADMRRQILVDSFFMLRVALVAMHPVAPDGCEKIVEDFGFFLPSACSAGTRRSRAWLSCATPPTSRLAATPLWSFRRRTTSSRSTNRSSNKTHGAEKDPYE